MAPTPSVSPPTAPHSVILTPAGDCSTQDVVVVIENVEKLLEENEDLEKKMESLRKKRNENSMKIVDLVKQVKELSEVTAVELMDEMEAFNESSAAAVTTNEEDLAGLMEEQHFLVLKIKESTRNLMDHEKLLLDLEKQRGRDDQWKDQFKNVQKFRVVHMKYKDAKEARLETIRQEIENIARERHVEAESRTGLRKKKVLKEKFVTRRAATSSSTTEPSNSRSRFALKRKLNESIVDCGEILKKISSKEKEAIVPKLLKVEVISPLNTYQCNVCSQVFTSAAPLVIHLEKHNRSEKVDCPFPSCFFTGTQEVLIKHVRSKHTKEMLFICSTCPMKFMTMSAKVSHEKKHNQPAWGQCDRAECLRFYQVAKGGCRCSSK